MSKLAVLQVADTGPLDSLVCMLNSVGYDCALPDNYFRHELRNIGCDTVLAVEDLIRTGSYEKPFYHLPEVSVSAAKTCNLFVDIKAQKNYSKICSKWPNLLDKILWYRINGGKPEHVINARGDHGDEVNPPCPVLTPNLWYNQECDQCIGKGRWYEKPDTPVCPACQGTGNSNSRFYSCWPPFLRWSDYYDTNSRATDYDSPVCLVHNLVGWGYGALVKEMIQMGVKMYGDGSPSGPIPHSKVPAVLARALAMVHLKSSDAPGYALYEAIAAGCPLIVSRRLVWRNKLEELFVHGKTCLVFDDREAHDHLTEEDVKRCTGQIGGYLYELSDPARNQVIGFGARDRLKELMWSADRVEDVSTLRAFMEKNYGS